MRGVNTELMTAPEITPIRERDTHKQFFTQMSKRELSVFEWTAEPHVFGSSDRVNGGQRRLIVHE